MDNDDAQALLAALKQLQTSRDIRRDTVEAVLTPRDGGVIPVECNITILDDESTARTTAVAVFRDISVRKAREERLSKFASVVSHDLRNPLDVALGQAEVLPDIADVGEETEQHLDEIYDSLKRMEHLIQDVLALSQDNPDDIQTAPVSLASVATEAWQNVETNGSTLLVNTDASVEAHRGRLLRLFENLFRNAVEHGSTGTRPGGDDSVEHGSTSPASNAKGEIGVTVEVGMLDPDDADGEPGFYVVDDGPGIDEEDREQLFEGGYSTTEGGTGLGLAIVREIANAHGWSVGLELSDERTDPTGARFELSGVTLSESG